MIVAIPSNFEAGQAIEQARAANEKMPIIGRAQSEAEADYLKRYGATHVIMSTDTLADAMLATYRTSIEPQSPPSDPA
jgi:CPA2 family monovalent cation:H+ antiporter-2